MLNINNKISLLHNAVAQVMFVDAIKIT